MSDLGQAYEKCGNQLILEVETQIGFITILKSWFLCLKYKQLCSDKKEDFFNKKYFPFICSQDLYKLSMAAFNFT